MDCNAKFSKARARNLSLLRGAQRSRTYIGNTKGSNGNIREDAEAQTTHDQEKAFVDTAQYT